MSMKVEFNDNFKEIVGYCVEKNAYIGEGNPNAKILFVGQEAALDEREKWYNENAQEWYKKVIDIQIQGEIELKRYKNEKNKEIFESQRTWSQYQKLHNYIFPDYSSERDTMNFEERIFTTEMSDNPAKTKGEAGKIKDFKIHLQERKNIFFRKDFIQDFPVVVLACSGYIENNPKNWEINDVFHVEYIGDEKGRKWYNKPNWFYLHYGKTKEGKSKLVIHTRQLSNQVNGQMLEDMGEIIREHLISIGEINNQND